MAILIILFIILALLIITKPRNDSVNNKASKNSPSVGDGLNIDTANSQSKTNSSPAMPSAQDFPYNYRNLFAGIILGNIVICTIIATFAVIIFSSTYRLKHPDGQAVAGSVILVYLALASIPALNICFRKIFANIKQLKAYLTADQNPLHTAVYQKTLKMAKIISLVMSPLTLIISTLLIIFAT